MIGKQHMEKRHIGLLHALPIGAGLWNKLFVMALKDPGPRKKRMIAAPYMPLIHNKGRPWNLKIAVVVHVFCDTERKREADRN